MLDELDTDIVISACILHDGMKYGNAMGSSKWTTKTHPQDMARFVELLGKAYKLEDGILVKLTEGIKLHMGQWSSYATKVFPKDFDKISQVVHIADLAASRPKVTVDLYEETPQLIG